MSNHFYLSNVGIGQWQSACTKALGLIILKVFDCYQNVCMCVLGANDNSDQQEFRLTKLTIAKFYYHIHLQYIYIYISLHKSAQFIQQTSQRPNI
jgi:hypothetical protein